MPDLRVVTSGVAPVNRIVSRAMDSLIVYTGRAGDRNTRGTSGAQMLGHSLARRFNLPTTVVSTPQPPLSSTLWDEQLAAAREDLHTLADTLSTHIEIGRAHV